MAWKYYKNGKLKAECDDIPETMEDAVRELREQGHDVSDCVLEPESNKDDTLPPICDDFWSPDYPPEEDDNHEHPSAHTINMNELVFKPLTDEEVERFEEYYERLLMEGKALQVAKDFDDKLYDRIEREAGIKMKPTRLDNIKSWWINTTTGSKVYLAFWITFTYILLGMIVQDRQILHSFLEIVLWPFFM